MLLTLATGGASGQDSFSASDTQLHPLGTRAKDNLGRVYRYCQMGAVDGVAGSLYQSAIPIANHLANTPPAVALGALSFTYTPGNTAGAANLYAEGFLQVDTTPGNGYTYPVSSHAAITGSTAFTLYLRDAIQVALTTSSRVGLIHNPYKNVIVSPTTLTAKPAGWAVCVIPATYYGWLQTRGPVSALIDGTPAIATPVTPSTNTAGAVMVSSYAVDGNAGTVTIAQPIVGYMAQVGVTAKNNFVVAAID